MKLEKVVIGSKEFGEKIDITDPCYERDVWCRLNDVAIKAGNYECVVWMNEDKRVGIIGIYLDGMTPIQDQMECIGEIGVDAGLAGFFNKKPDYTRSEWMDFCDNLDDGHAWIQEVGFFSESGYGDGGYDVYATKNDAGEIVALEIRFM